MKFTHRRDVHILYSEFFAHDMDMYRFRKYRPGHFNHIVDIGANVGMFALLARFIQPTATIDAYDPDKRAFKALTINAENLHINCYHVGVGNGNPIFRKAGHSSIGHSYLETSDDVNPAQSESMRLIDMLPSDRSGCYVKMDCEGGENAIFGDPESCQALGECLAIGMETHGSHGMTLDEASKRWCTMLQKTHHVKRISKSRKGRIFIANRKGGRDEI